MEYIPEAPWIRMGVRGTQLVAECQACGASAHGGDAVMDGFLELHSAHQSSSQTHLGLGDAFAGLTQRLGLNHCTPCEQRRMVLNGLVPKLPWLRR